MFRGTIAAAIILASLCIASAQPQPQFSFVLGADTLKSIDAVHVMVEPFEPTVAGEMNLSHTLLTSRVELALRREGIRVIELADVQKHDRRPCLYISVNTLVTTTTGAFVYNLSAKFQQLMLIPTEPAMVTIGATWTREMVGHCSKAAAREQINTAVDSVVNEFLNAYLKANPKK